MSIPESSFSSPKTFPSGSERLRGSPDSVSLALGAMHGALPEAELLRVGALIEIERMQ